MRRVSEILRLKHGGASDRQIARSLNVACSTVGLTLERVAAAGLRWPLPATLSDRVLEAMLYAGNGALQGARRKAEADWAYIHHELRRPGVTLLLLWEEYRGREPDGYQYSRWCELYRVWEGRLSPTMRQSHPAGERMFVDYAGQTIDVIDAGTGEVRPAQIFVAAMGASNYTYAEVTATQSLPDWIGAHVRALAFMGGVPAQLVPDNPKVGVDRANWYEPGLNRTYLDLAMHYGTAILPTRPRKPRDKAKVEVAVLVVERWILAVCSSPATVCASSARQKSSPLDPMQPPMGDHTRPAGAPPPRPTSVGTAGRLRSKWVADINRNARPTSSEYARRYCRRVISVHMLRSPCLLTHHGYHNCLQSLNLFWAGLTTTGISGAGFNVAVCSLMSPPPRRSYRSRKARTQGAESGRALRALARTEPSAFSLSVGRTS